MARYLRAAVFAATLLAGPLRAYGAPAVPPHVSVVVNPSWKAKPTEGQIAQFYPAAANKAGVGGRAMIGCIVQATGAVTDCKVLTEDPPGLGFGEAAVELSTVFQMRPKAVDGVPVGGARVTVPIQFVPPAPSDPIKELEADSGLAFKRALPKDWDAVHGKMVEARKAGASNAELEAIGDAFFETFEPRMRAAVLKAPSHAIRQLIQAIHQGSDAECSGAMAAVDGDSSPDMTKTEGALLEAMFVMVAQAESAPSSYGPATAADLATLAAAYQQVGAETPAVMDGQVRAGDATAQARACEDRTWTGALLTLPPDVLGRIWGDGMGKSFQDDGLSRRR